MTVAHDERLSPSPATWLLVPGATALGFVLLLPVALPAAIVGALVLGAGTAAGLVAASTPVRVADGELRAGPARIPVDRLGEAAVLDEADWREAMGTGYDPRAHVVSRGWVHTGVRVPVRDQEDPTPFWLVATRHPARLAAAIEGARSALP